MLEPDNIIWSLSRVTHESILQINNKLVVTVYILVLPAVGRLSLGLAYLQNLSESVRSRFNERQSKKSDSQMRKVCSMVPWSLNPFTYNCTCS